MKQGLLSIFSGSFIVILLGCSTSGSFRPIEAKQLAQEGHYDESVKLYQQHFAERLNAPDRPANENPYFYYVLIGDVYLKQNKPTEALQYYLDAHKNNIDNKLFADRIHQLGIWYKANNQLQTAFDLLKQYHDLDPLILDFEMDQIHREMVKREEEGLQ